MNLKRKLQRGKAQAADFRKGRILKSSHFYKFTAKERIAIAAGANILFVAKTITEHNPGRCAQDVMPQITLAVSAEDAQTKLEAAKLLDQNPVHAVPSEIRQ